MTVAEIQIRLNKLVADDRQNVTTSAQKLDTIYTFAEATLKDVKTIVLNNLSSNDIYFGPDNTVTTANAGGILRSGESREFPIVDLRETPYFIADSNSAMGIEVWA